MKWMKFGLVLALLSFCAVPSAFSDDIDELKNMLSDMRSDYEEKISALENKIQQLEVRQESAIDRKVAIMKEEIKETQSDQGIDVDYVGRYNGEFQKGGLEIHSHAVNSTVTIGGYMDHEFENFENTNSTFDQHRWIINIGASIGERLRFFSEYEIEHGGPDAGGEAKVEQAFVDYLIEDWVNVRFGAVLVPFGRTNIYHDSDLRDTTSRPLVDRDIIPTTWTESGVGVYGEFNPVIGDYEDLIVSYETYIINGLDDGFSDTGMRGARGSLSSDNNNSKAIAGRLVLSPMIGHEFGFSGYWGKYNGAGDAITGGALDFLSKFGPLEFEGEYALFSIDEPVGMDIADTMQGYYLQANYHFWPAFLSDTFIGRSFSDPTFTLFARVGMAEIDDDSDVGTGDNQEDRFTLGLNYRPVESWVFKVEHQWNSTDNESLERGDNNGWFASVAMGF